MAKSLIWLLWLMVAAGSATAASGPDNNLDPISYEVAFCHSQTPVITIDQATACDYKTSARPLKSGFGESPRWIRINILTPHSDRQFFSIQVRPFFLREISLYSQNANGWSEEKSGSHNIDLLHSEIGGHFFITKPSNKPINTYYIQTQSNSIAPVSVSINAWPNSSLHPSEHLLGIGAQIGILLTILAFSLVSLGLNPSVLMARFNIYTLNLILCILSGSGILALFVFKNAPLFNELLFFIGLCLKLGLWVWLAQAFLRDYKTPSWYRGSCAAIYILVATSIAIGFMGKIDVAIFLILIGYTLTAIAQILATIKTPDAGKSFRIALISGFSFTLLLIYLAIASAFFPIENNGQIPLYLARLTDFVNPLVMLSIIVFQNRLVRKELTKVKNALIETRLRAEFEGRLLKDRRTLIDMLTHELKNPLASIALAADTLSQSNSTRNDNDLKRLHNINQAISSMDTIIERCSLMNSIDENQISKNPTYINIDSMISSLIKVLGCSDRVEIQVGQNIKIATDPQFLQIILTNLIENSLKYSPPDTKIKICANEFHENGTSSIRFGIANEVSDELRPDPSLLFDRFYRHPLAKHTRGSGLGLSICKELCNTLGGSIGYQLICNEATFTIELPI